MTAASEPRDPAALEAAIDALYRDDLEAFTDARNRLAKQCKQQGDREGAERVKALRKPSLSAWLVNALWWDAQPEFETLLRAARRVREAQTQSGGLSLQQEAAAERRRALDQLLARARARLEAAGRTASPALQRRVATTLEACAALADRLPTPGPGRLSEDLDPPGFDAWTASRSPSEGPAAPETRTSVGSPRVAQTDPTGALSAVRRDPAATPAEPSAIPAEPSATPAEPSATPAEPSATPAELRRLSAEAAVTQARDQVAQILRLTSEARRAWENAATDAEARTLRWTHAMDALEVAKRAAARAQEERDEAEARAQSAKARWTQKQAELEAIHHTLASAEEALRRAQRGEPDTG